jgi:GGDEF domain-containing protein
VVHLERLDLLDDGLRDHVASVVAGRLLTSVRDGDTVARLEPAEFVVLLEDVAVDRIAADVGSRIVSSLALPIELPGTQAGTIELGVAIGAAIHDGVTGVGQLMVAADEAASRAREAADGEVVIVGRRPD